MTVRLSKAFGPSPDMCVRLQANYDLAQVRQDQIGVLPPCLALPCRKEVRTV